MTPVKQLLRSVMLLAPPATAHAGRAPGHIDRNGAYFCAWLDASGQ